jgi:hypothetical protein
VAPYMHLLLGVNRKLALIVAAIVLPGGLIVLVGAMVLKALTQTARGRKVVELAQKRVPALQTLRSSVLREREVA